MNAHALTVLEFVKVRRMLVRWTFSPWGRRLAQALEPDLSLEAVQLSQERISEWKALELAGLAPGSAEIPDLDPLLVRLQKGETSLDGAELYSFLPFLVHLGELRKLRQALSEGTVPRPRLLALMADLSDFSSLRQRLQRSLSSSGELLDTASPALARVRREKLEAQRQASELLGSLLERLPAGSEEAFVTLREGRYVLSVKAQQRGALRGILHGRSHSGHSVLLEPLEALETNNEVAERSEEEKREEARILAELTDTLRASAASLSAGMTSVASLDLIRAEALLALGLRAEAPEFNTEGRLRIVGGRHPILAAMEEQGGHRVVPLEIEVLSRTPVLLISGPNMGGKTVALKTVGLLVLMARAGLHVPSAVGTDLPFVDDLFVDLGDEQSIEGDLSTFAGHLKNVGEAWGNATSRSLVLLDEIGGGTDPEEGGALAMALLEGLAERRCLTVATTHLTSLKLFVEERPGMQNASVEFDPVTQRPRFTLKVGEPGRSRAFEIARRILPDPGLLEKAEKFRDPRLAEMDRLFDRLEGERRRVQEERESLAAESGRLREAVARRDRQASRLREKLEAIRAGEEARLGRLYRGAEEEVRKIREALETRLREPRPETALPAARLAERELARRALEETQRTRPRVRGRRLSPESLRIGDQAWLSEFGAVVRIERLDLASGRVWVEWQGRRVEVHPDVLEEVPPDRAAGPRPSRAPSIPETSSAGSGQELDLRGLRVEEALEQLDRFLDRAAIERRHQVRIIHGKGTGTLKREVERVLQGHPLVGEYRTGELTEGGWGVTVATVAPVGQ